MAYLLKFKLSQTKARQKRLKKADKVKIQAEVLSRPRNNIQLIISRSYKYFTESENEEILGLDDTNKKADKISIISKALKTELCSEITSSLEIKINIIKKKIKAQKSNFNAINLYIKFLLINF